MVFGGDTFIDVIIHPVLFHFKLNSFRQFLIVITFYI